MKALFIMTVALIVSSTAHAQLLVAKGTKATLQVEYQYSASGKYESPSKNRTSDWSVQRAIHLTTTYVADAPQPFGVLHSQDAGQQAASRNLQPRSANAQQKMQPTMADMMKIVEKCGEKNEACISREVEKYGTGMQVTPDIKSAQTDVAAISKAPGARFQLWRSTSQNGTYSINELHHEQVFEMTCTRTGTTCKREETRKGDGVVPPPAGGKSAAGASMLEVDGVGKDIVINLPVPLAPVGYTQTVTTTIPGQKGGVTKLTGLPWTFHTNKPITVTIPGDLRSLSGTQTYKTEGSGADSGTLTVKWRFMTH